MEKVYSDLLDKIDELQPNYYGFEQVVFSAMDLLNDRDFNLNHVSVWLRGFLDIYSQDEVYNRIKFRIYEVIKENPEAENLFIIPDYEFSEDEKEDDNFDLEKSCEYLRELNPTGWVEHYEWLEDWKSNHIDETIPIPTMLNAKPYEAMAILALYYVGQAIRYNTPNDQLKEYERFHIFGGVETEQGLQMRKIEATRKVISAFLSIQIAHKWKYELEKDDISKKH